MFGGDSDHSGVDRLRLEAGGLDGCMLAGRGLLGAIEVGAEPVEMAVNAVSAVLMSVVEALERIWRMTGWC